MSRLVQSIRHPIFLASLLRVVALVLGVIGSIVIARLGGTELKGVSSAYAAANAVLFTFLNFDLAQQALRDYRSSGEPRIVGAALSRAWVVYCVIALSALGLMYYFDSPTLWIIVGACCLTLGMQGGVGALGFKGALVNSTGAVIQQLAVILGVLLAFQMDSLNADSVRTAIAISYLAPLFLYVPFIFKRGKGAYSLSWHQLAHMLSRGVPWQLGRFMQMLLQKLDILIVFAVLGASAAGLYSVGVATAMLCTIIPAQISNQVLHRATRDRVVNFRIMREFWFALIAGSAPAVVLLAFGRPLLTLMYGDEFAPAYQTLVLALPGAIAYGALQVQTNFIRIRGGWRLFFIRGALAVVVMLFCLWFFVPMIGEAGAALAFSVATIVSVVLGMVFFRTLFLEADGKTSES